MPHFHLDLHNFHIEATDPDGHDLPDLDAAHKLAIEGIRDFIGHEAFGGKIDLRGRIEIRDGLGKLLLTVPFRDAFECHVQDAPH